MAYLDSNINLLASNSLCIATLAILFSIYRYDEERMSKAKKKKYLINFIDARQDDYNFKEDLESNISNIIAAEGTIESISINVATGFNDYRKEAYIIYTK